MKPRGSRTATLVTIGLALVGLGFFLASLDPGSGPRTVPGAAFLGPFYLPPLIVALAVWVVASESITRKRWASLLGGMVAFILILGSAAFGAEAILYRLGHPGEVVGFIADVFQIAGEFIALAGALIVLLRRPARTN